MQITIKQPGEKLTPTVFGPDIPIGTVFIGKIHGSESVFLRTYGGIVDLNSPSETWLSVPFPQIEDYESVEAQLIVTRTR